MSAYESFSTLETLLCDILLTPHPGFASTLDKLKEREAGGQPAAFIDPQSCIKYASTARDGLKKRISKEDAALGPKRN